MPHKHRVVDGECLESIALLYGFSPDTIWARAENEALRTLRKNSHVLAPGDELFIPDREAKSVPVTTGRRHRFRRRGVPAVLRVRLQEDGEVLAGVDYTLTVDDGPPIEGTTGDDGCVEHWIAPGAVQAVLTLDDGTTYRLRLGRLRPAADSDGVASRLRNLGYLGPLSLALARFQRDQSLEESGAADEATLAKLAEVHGS